MRPSPHGRERRIAREIVKLELRQARERAQARAMRAPDGRSAPRERLR